jgi:hypothetical protein
MTSPRLFLVAGALAVGLVPTFVGGRTADAQKKPKVQRACGITAIPLTVGNSWTYEPVAHPATQDPENPLREGWDRLYPIQPTKVVITVSAVETANGVTTIKLDETATHTVKGDGKDQAKKKDTTFDRTLATTMTCTATSLTVSPESFWFAGEPGGAWNATVTVTERKGHTFPIVTGKLDGTEWHDDLTATWKRDATAGTDAKLGEGKLQLERRIVLISDTEAVGTTSGSYTKATKLGIETHGQITIDGTEGKPYELPEGLYSFYWMVDGVGVVLVNNGFLQAYQLSSFTVAK